MDGQLLSDQLHYQEAMKFNQSSKSCLTAYFFLVPLSKARRTGSAPEYTSMAKDARKERWDLEVYTTARRALQVEEVCGTVGL